MALGGGGGGGAGEGGRGVGPVAHFGFPAEFHLVNEEEGEAAGIGERPQVCTCVRACVGGATLVLCCSAIIIQPSVTSQRDKGKFPFLL